jgi:16S rRNA (guanine527-N7)-methyltransferase
MMVIEKNKIAPILRDAVEKAASKMGIEVEEGNISALIEYAEELKKWNKAYNLVGRKLDQEGLVSLLIDAISPLVIKGLIEEGKEVLDIGSGAGLPGIPLYLLAGPFSLTMVESQRKRITFIRHICRKLSMGDARVYPGRVEEMLKEEDHLNAYEIGLARAVMDPMRMIRTASPLMCEGGRLVLFVGKADAERIRKESINLERKGAKLETLRSTQRFVGKEHFLAIISKKSG